MLTLTLVALSLGADADRTLLVEVAKSLPAFSQIAVYRSDDAKQQTLLATLEAGKPAKLGGAGPFDVIATPKGGLPVRIAHKLEIKPGTTHALRLADFLGVVEVFGDNFPRAEAIVITAKDDPGPGEKGHVPLQRASDYRVEMVVPDGKYAVWVIPANGARALKVNDDVRVLAGHRERVE